MKKTLFVCAIVGLSFAAGLSAQMPSLTFGTDYTLSTEVTSVTTVKVAPNRIDHYLAGLKQSWVPSTKIGQEMGLNAGHAIYISELPDSGDYNVTLVVRFESMAQREKGNDPKIAAELQRRTEEQLSKDKSFAITQGYTEIREIVGEYLTRQVTLK